MTKPREETNPAIEWLAAWVAEGREALAPAGPAASEIPAADRARLDPVVEVRELRSPRDPRDRET